MCNKKNEINYCEPETEINSVLFEKYSKKTTGPKYFKHYNYCNKKTIKDDMKQGEGEWYETVKSRKSAHVERMNNDNG
jgi:hypothetical protein